MAEGGGLLNRYTVKSCIGGSNPPLSASKSLMPENFWSQRKKHRIWPHSSCYRDANL